MSEDFFISINDEPCFIKKPDEPNGYGVIFLGGSGCFVTDKTSDFHQNSIRNDFLNELAKEGYTIGYSNAHNKNWGNNLAIKDIERLHATMVEECNLNPSIHLIGNSMGCVLALNLLKEKNIALRSLILMKPVMDLFEHRNYVFKREKTDRILDELSEAYEIKKEHILADLINKPFDLSQESYKDVRIKVVYGDKDDLVPFENNRKIIAMLENSCSSIEILALNNATHQDDKLFFDLDLYLEFLVKSE